MPSRPPHLSRRALMAAAGTPLLALLGCGGGGGEATGAAATGSDGTGTAATSALKPAQAVKPEITTESKSETTRSWKMGFSRVPPRFDISSQLQNLQLMRDRAEFVLMQEQVPWAELLAGVPALQLVERDHGPLVDYARSLGLDIVFMPELTDGLSRNREAAGLLATGHQLGETLVQQRFADYLLAVSRRLRPQVLGLAAETNAVRLAAPASTYGNLVQTVQQGASALRADGFAGELMVSVQVEVAWGLMPGQRAYEGIAADLRDFAFVQKIGLSSYPYIAYSQPEDLPSDYYQRLLPAGAPPAMVVEGGWPSTTVGTRQSSAAMQARYVTRHAVLLDSVAARGWAPLVQADLDLAGLPPDMAAGLSTFACLGVMDSGFVAKPALSVWDGLHARRLQT